jgi:hypothetical protein
MDWVAWHEKYDDPDSGLAGRLVEVQARIRTALDTAPPGPLRVISLCAGQGRDLIGALADHPRGPDVTARLVEVDERLVGSARSRVADAGLSGVKVLLGDAGCVDNYADLAPADLLLLCGIFGNISEADIEGTIAHCPALVRPGGSVIWTRGRGEPDLVPTICEWFERSGFEELMPPTPHRGVGFHRFNGNSTALPAGTSLFQFIRYE